MRFCSGKNLALSLIVFFIATPVLADTIDGNWCSIEGLHVAIKGPAVVTPSGARAGAGNAIAARATNPLKTG